jgi:hypothetical protein
MKTNTLLLLITIYCYCLIPGPKLNYEHTEWGYFRLGKLDVSPTPVDEKIAQKLKEIREA